MWSAGEEEEEEEDVSPSGLFQCVYLRQACLHGRAWETHCEERRLGLIASLVVQDGPALLVQLQLARASLDKVVLSRRAGQYESCLHVCQF